jgi:hypothetical protein
MYVQHENKITYQTMIKNRDINFHLRSRVSCAVVMLKRRKKSVMILRHERQFNVHATLITVKNKPHPSARTILRVSKQNLLPS